MRRKETPALGEFWCRLMHQDISWPVNGHYRCKQCRREFQVSWEDSVFRHRPARTAEIIPAREQPALETIAA
jgi:hypothetical protein